MGAGPIKASGHERGPLINFGAKIVGALFGPTTVRKESETKNLRNLCNLRIFPNSLRFNDRFHVIFAG